MSGNTIQETRKLLKPKSKRVALTSKKLTGQHPPMFAPIPGEEPVSLFANTAPSFNFSQGSQAAPVSNPFTNFSNPGPNTAKRAAEDADETHAKKVFGSFSSTTSSQNTSSVFGKESSLHGKKQQTSFSFSTPSIGPAFGNSQEHNQPRTSSFTLSGTQAQPSSSTSNIFGGLTASSQQPTTSLFGQSFKGSIFGSGSDNWGSSNAAATTSSIENPSQLATPSFTLFGQTVAANQTPAKAASFTFGVTQPQSTAFSNLAAAIPQTTLFGSTSDTMITPTITTSILSTATTQTAGASSFGSNTKAPASGSVFDSVPKRTVSSFTFGDKPATSLSIPAQSSNMFSNMLANSSQTPSHGAVSTTTSNTSQQGSSTPAASSVPALTTSIFTAFGTTASSPKPAPDSNLSVSGASNEQTSKLLTFFGASENTQDNSNWGTSSSPGTLGNKTEQPANSDLFGTVSDDNSQPPSNTFNFFTSGNSSGNAANEVTTTPTKQQSGTNGIPLFGSITSNLDSSKDGSANYKTATSSFMQKHKPSKPSPLSQSPLTQSSLSKPMSNYASADTEKSSNNAVFAGASQLNSNTNGMSTLFESPSKSAEDLTKYSAQEKREYDAAKRLRGLTVAVEKTIRRMPITADLTAFFEFYHRKRREIMGDVVRTAKRKAIDDEANEEGSGPSSSKRQRRNNGQAATTPPKSVQGGEAQKKLRSGDQQAACVTSSQDVFRPSIPLQTPSKEPVRPAQTPARPFFEFPMTSQSLTNGSNMPGGARPMNLFATAQSMRTPAQAISKTSPQTEKPKSSTSSFSAGTSTVPRNPQSKESSLCGSKPAPPSLNRISSVSTSKHSSSLAAKDKAPAQSNRFASSVSKATTGQASNYLPMSRYSSSPTKRPPPASIFSSSQNSALPPASLGGKRKASSQFTKDDLEAQETGLSTPNGKKQGTAQPTQPLFETLAEITPPTSGGKRKAENQLTKGDSEVESPVSKIPKISRQSETSMLFKNILDSPRQNNGESQVAAPKKMFSLNKSGDFSKPRLNPFAGLDAAQNSASVSTQIATNTAAQVTSQKNMFSLTKSEDSASTTATQANPFAAPGVAHTPAPAATQIATPKAYAGGPGPVQAGASSFVFGSHLANNVGASKPLDAPALFAESSNGFSSSTSGLSAPIMPSSAALKGGISAAEQFRQKAKEEGEKKALQKAIDEDYDSEEDGDKFEWIEKWKEERVAKQKQVESSALQVPKFGAPSSGSSDSVTGLTSSSSSNVSAVEQFRQKAKQEAEKIALQKAIDEDYDSEEDGAKAEWIQRWKETRAEQEKKAQEITQQSKAVFIPGKGFSFLSQDSAKENSLGHSSQTKSLFSQTFASSTDVPQASIFGPTTSVCDPATEPGAETPDSPMEGTGPGIASAKKPTSTSALPQFPSAEGSTPKASGSLFDRIQRDRDGNAIPQIPVENKENAQPSSPFNFLSASQPADKTWNPNTPIKFGAAASASSQNFTAATPPAQKNMFDFSASIKPSASATASDATPAPGSLFGSNAAKPFAITFGSASSSVSQTPTPALSSAQSGLPNVVIGSSCQQVSSSDGETPAFAPASGLNLFGNTKPPSVLSGFGSRNLSVSSSGGANPASAPASGRSLFGNTAPQSIFSGFGDTKTAIGFNFGGQTSSATSSLFPSSAASTPNTRDTTPGDTTANDSNAATEASGDPDAEHHEQLNLTESRAGEEDEDILHECRAKAKFWDNEKKDWVAKGAGILRVLKHRETGATRTLLRVDPSAKVILNKSLIGSFNYTATAKFVKLFTAAEDSKGLETWFLQIKTAEMATALAKVLEENKPKPA